MGGRRRLHDKTATGAPPQKSLIFAHPAPDRLRKQQESAARASYPAYHERDAASPVCPAFALRTRRGSRQTIPLVRRCRFWFYVPAASCEDAAISPDTGCWPTLKKVGYEYHTDATARPCLTAE